MVFRPPGITSPVRGLLYQTGRKITPSTSLQSSSFHFTSIGRQYLHNSSGINTEGKQPSKEHLRLQRIISKSKFLTKLNKNPKFERYFDRLAEIGAIPTVTSFLILHELTAIVPLFLLWYILYNLDSVNGVTIDDADETKRGTLLGKCNKAIERLVGDKYDDRGWDKPKLILSGAISYSVVKILGPLRVIVSLWGAPYFGRYLVLPFYKLSNFLKKA